jgi:hypothetical protein
MLWGFFRGMERVTRTSNWGLMDPEAWIGIQPERGCGTSRMERWVWCPSLCRRTVFVAYFSTVALESTFLFCEFECPPLLRKFWYPLLVGAPPFEKDFGVLTFALPLCVHGFKI